MWELFEESIGYHKRVLFGNAPEKRGIIKFVFGVIITNKTTGMEALSFDMCGSEDLVSPRSRQLFQNGISWNYASDICKDDVAVIILSSVNNGSIHVHVFSAIAGYGIGRDNAADRC